MKRKQSLFSADEGSWTEEVWVDGPRAQPATKQAEVDVQGKRKQKRIEEWIQSMTKQELNTLEVCMRARMKLQFIICLLQLAKYDLNKTFTKHHPSSPYHRGNATDVQAGNEDAHNNTWDTNSTLVSESISMAEPPKTLKLEKFLQQLSCISEDSLHMAGMPNYSDNYRLFSPFKRAQSLQQTSMNVANQNIAKSVEQASSVSSSAEAVCLDAAKLEDGGHESMASQAQSAKCKLKRNTTSTTTSGHGTISEGECWSVAAKKTSATDVSTPSYGSGHPIAIVQHQPASSGYDSTNEHEDRSEKRSSKKCNRMRHNCMHLWHSAAIAAKQPAELLLDATPIATGPSTLVSHSSLTNLTSHDCSPFFRYHHKHSIETSMNPAAAIQTQLAGSDCDFILHTGQQHPNHERQANTKGHGFCFLLCCSHN